MNPRNLLLSSLSILVLVASLVVAARPAESPLVVDFTWGNISNDGDLKLAYKHGEEGVRADLLGPGNIVLDPDSEKNKPGRAIILGGPFDGAPAFFMSINSVGKACIDGDEDPGPASELKLLDCIQSNVAVNAIEGDVEGVQGDLRCGDDANGDTDRTGLDNVAVTCLEVDDLNRCVKWSVTPWRLNSVVNCALFDFRGKGRNRTFQRLTEAFDMAFEAEVCLDGSTAICTR